MPPSVPQPRLARLFPLALLATTATLALTTATTPAQAQETQLDLKLVKQGRAEAETIWRRGFTLQPDSTTEHLQSLLDTLSIGRPLEPELKLQVGVFRSPDLNAFCLPDGSLYVFSGLLASMNSWDEVGFVLAHESQHARGWHAQKNLSQAKGKIAAMQVLSMGATIGLAAGGASSGAFLINSLAQLGLGLATAAMVNGYGRNLETEADLAGVTALKDAGRPPCAAAGALQILLDETEEHSKVANFFWGNHPLLRDRIEDVDEQIVGDCVIDTTVAPDYRAVKCEMLRLTANQWAEANERDKALTACRRYRALTGDDPEILTWQGFACAQSADEDTLTMAVESFEQARRLAAGDYRLPLRGLSNVALARGDTAAAIEYLAQYLADAPEGTVIPDRRACRRRLQALREGKPILEPLPADSRKRTEDRNRSDEEF